MTTDSDDCFRRQWELNRDAGRVLAAALARLIEAYESSPDRARHALSWEHLPGRVGSSRPISERDEASAAKSSDSAKLVIQTSMLHDGETSLSEYSQLLDDWNLISDRGEEESFKLDEYLGSNHPNWEVTGEGLTPTEKRRLHGWSVEDLKILRSRDPELLSEYRQELEKEAVKHAERGQDYTEAEENRKIWIGARLADVDSFVESEMLRARANELEAQLSRWKQIEHMRTDSENWGSLRLWAEIPEDARPEKPAWDERRFPDSLTPEMRSVYETTEQKKNQVWRTPSREIVDEYEALVGQLVALSEKLPTTAGIAREMARREKDRAENYRGGPRVPIPTDYGWYEYCSLAMDDEANFAREIEDEVRGSGSLWIHWAKELVGMLPAIAKRAVEFGKHPISDIPKDRVPESLRVLFEQAHLCYLFNFDIPCVVTCGSLLEDAFKTRFRDLAIGWEKQRNQSPPKYVSLLGKAKDVVSQDPRSKVSAFLSFEYSSLWEINDARRYAVHDPGTYLAGGKRKSEEVLRKTRDILDILFEPVKSQTGKN